MILRQIKLLVVVFIYGSVISYAQNKYNEDIIIFKELLEKYHPSLYDYTSKKQFDSIWKNTFKVSKTLKNEYELTNTLARIIEKIGDGHTSLSPSQKFMEKVASKNSFFPIPVKVLNHKIYALDNNLGIEIGKEINAINNIPSEEIITNLYDILSSDGKNVTFKNNLLDDNFALYFHFLYPKFKSFTITLKDNNTIVEAKGTDLNSALKQASNTIIKYKQFNNTDAIQLKMVNDSTAYLGVNTFHFADEDTQGFIQYLEQIFISLNEGKIPNLIIDVRNNNGGLRELAIQLYSFLGDKPFKQRSSTRIKTSSIDYKHINNNKLEVKEVTKWLKERFGGTNMNTTDHLQNLMQPNAIQYKGNIYVITGNGTFSAGGEFALNAKNDPKITLVGQETGAAYKFHNGDYSYNFILPNSNIGLTIPSTHIIHFTNSNNNKSIGIVPDYYVPLSIEDYINGNDTSIKKIIELIKK